MARKKNADLLDRMTAEQRTASRSTAQDTSVLVELGDEMETLNEEIVDLNAQLSTAKARYDEVRKERLPVIMEELGLVNEQGKGSFTMASGAKIHLTNTVKVSYTEENRPLVMKWLRKIKAGSLIKETVHYQTLRAFIKERIEEGFTDVPDAISQLHETTAVLRKPPKKRGS